MKACYRTKNPLRHAGKIQYDEKTKYFDTIVKGGIHTGGPALLLELPRRAPSSTSGTLI